MSTKPYKLIPSYLRDYKIQSWWKSFSHVPKRDSKVLKAKKTSFLCKYGMCVSIFLLLSELGTCLQNLISTRGMEHWKKKDFPQGIMLKFTYKGYFMTIKKAYKKLLYWKSKWWSHALVSLLLIEVFFWDLSKSQVLVVFQSSSS
jgi:hypothetical protein